MLKKILLVLAVVIACGGGYWLWSNYGQENTTDRDLALAPSRAAEITGKIVNIEGNEVIIAKEMGRQSLSEAEQAAKKAEMQKLSEEARKAAREEETAQYPTENITLTIPVGIPIAQGTGDGSGNSNLVDLSALTKGTYVSVWTNGEIVEYVKIKGL